VGPVADRIGRRKVLIPAVLIFSATAGLTGFAGGIVSLLFLRLIMGFSEGAFIPACSASVMAASRPDRRGLNFGVLGTGLPILGLTIGPIIATQLLHVTGSWRTVFAVVALPGFLLAYLMYKVLREPEAVDPLPSAAKPTWREALRQPNLALLCLIMACISGSLNVIIAMTPSYLVSHLGVKTPEMGFILSSGGLGALTGSLVFSALSDRLGRKPVLMGAAAAAALALWAFISAPADPLRLFFLFGAVAGFPAVVISINGILTFESVPPAIASTAFGLMSGVGEILGGAIAPFLAGYVAQRFGIQHVFGVAMAGLLACLALSCFLRSPQQARSSVDGDGPRREYI
jgi:MFS family permease